MSLHPLAHEMSQGKLSVVIQNVKQDKSHLGFHVFFFFLTRHPSHGVKDKPISWPVTKYLSKMQDKSKMTTIARGRTKGNYKISE